MRLPPEELIPLIGKLHRENGVVLSIHGRSLVSKSVIELLKLHDFVSTSTVRP